MILPNGIIFGVRLVLLTLLCPNLVSAQDGCLNLFWTAPGDDSTTGRASIYEIRYSIEPITEDNWEAAMKAPNPPLPKPAGSAERFTLRGLERDVVYYVAIKAADEVLNWSMISDVVHRSELVDTCIGMVGNVDCDPDQQVNIADVTALAAHIFNTNLAPCICYTESDINVPPDGNVNVSDLMKLLRYVFFGSELLSSCR